MCSAVRCRSRFSEQYVLLHGVSPKAETRPTQTGASFFVPLEVSGAKIQPLAELRSTTRTAHPCEAVCLVLLSWARGSQSLAVFLFSLDRNVEVSACKKEVYL